MRIVLTGASGQLGAYLLPCLKTAGHEVVAWSGGVEGEVAGTQLRRVDITDPSAVESELDRADPDAILHAAAMSTAEGVRLNPEFGARLMSRRPDDSPSGAARRRRIVFTSTDLVFDGSKAWNREEGPALPVLAYGKTKRLAEDLVREVEQGVVARVSLLYGPTRAGRPGFFDKAMAAIEQGEPQTFFEDEFRTPLDLGSAGRILTELIASDFAGTIHVGGSERMSRFELMERAAIALELDPALVRSNRQSDVKFAEPRPADVSLDTTRLAEVIEGLRDQPWRKLFLDPDGESILNVAAQTDQSLDDFSGSRPSPSESESHVHGDTVCGATGESPRGGFPGGRGTRSSLRADDRNTIRAKMHNTRLRRVVDSMDICQSVMANFFTRAAFGEFDLEAPDQLVGLLVTMAKNKVVSQSRRALSEKRDVRRLDPDGGLKIEALEGAEQPDIIVADRELIALIREKLNEDELNVADRRCSGDSWQEIADALGGTPDGRHKQYSRALQRVLKELGLEESGDDE